MSPSLRIDSGAFDVRAKGRASDSALFSSVSGRALASDTWLSPLSRRDLRRVPNKRKHRGLSHGKTPPIAVAALGLPFTPVTASANPTMRHDHHHHVMHHHHMMHHHRMHHHRMHHRHMMHTM